MCGLLLTVDYPLGFLACQVFKELMAVLGKPRGVHDMGKAATLQGQVGDVIRPNRVCSRFAPVARPCGSSFWRGRVADAAFLNSCRGMRQSSG